MKVKNGVVEDPLVLRQPAESFDDYMSRSGEYQQTLLMTGGIEAAMGNHVIVEHAGGEYSVYAHLQPGSITVRPGERVVAGSQLGRVGSSGNSTEPHLHFQLNDGPDVSTARGLPVEFTGIQDRWLETRGRHLRAGQIVEPG